MRVRSTSPIGLLTDQEPEAYEAIGRRADAAGIDVVSVFHDLLCQPAIGPLLLMARVTIVAGVGLISSA